MPLRFNTLLEQAGFNLEDVRLVRHKDKRAARGVTPYDLWCDEKTRYLFDRYQSVQAFHKQKILDAGYWAVFLGTPSNETLFVGVYEVEGWGELNHRQEVPTRPGEFDEPGSGNEYSLRLLPELQEYVGKLVIDWGPGALQFTQYAHKNDKPIIELRPEFKEPNFPGALNFTRRLSQLDGLPISWINVLKELKGVYLLTCPKTGLQYVGKADGDEGFWGRWQDYVLTCHGHNIGMRHHHKRHHKRPESCDYQVSILEVAGSAATPTEILEMERKWITKLNTVEMGLNE